MSTKDKEVVKRVKSSEIELKDKLVAINRVTKVTKGGRHFSFSAIVVVGNEKNTHTAFLVKAGPRTKLVQLDLTLQENDKNVKDRSFVLEGIFNKKRAYLKSGEPVVELSPVLMQ